MENHAALSCILSSLSSCFCFLAEVMKQKARGSLRICISPVSPWWLISPHSEAPDERSVHTSNSTQRTANVKGCRICFPCWSLWNAARKRGLEYTRCWFYITIVVFYPGGDFFSSLATFPLCIILPVCIQSSLLMRRTWKTALFKIKDSGFIHVWGLLWLWHKRRS